MARTFRRIPPHLLNPHTQSRKEYDEDFLIRCVRGHVDYDMPHKMFGPKVACDCWSPADKRYFKRQHRRFERRVIKNQLKQEIA